MAVTFTVTLTDDEAKAVVNDWTPARTGTTPLREGHRKILQELQIARNNRVAQKAGH